MIKVVPSILSAHFSMLLGFLTPVRESSKELKPFVSDIVLVLVMSVNPGFCGQELTSKLFCRVERLRELNVARDYVREVDGAIKLENVRLVQNG